MNEETWSAQMTQKVNDRLQAGQTFLGAVDGSGVVELVFTDDGDGFNLVSFSPERGIQVGFVASPEIYAE